ncbi:lipoprotein [Halioglobus japonicus]|nr:lipoprotein [Halioglobus japonicus]
MSKVRTLSVVLLGFFLASCAEMQTKQQAFPAMYTDQKPVSMVIVPAINETTAADAGDLLNVTISQPFANHGYYVMPIPIVADIWKSEGVLEGDQLKGMPTSVFLETFGADSVLFLTINTWDTNYAVIAANVTVGLEYVLLSTRTNDVLWSYEEQVIIDTGSSSGNLLVDVIATAVSTAVTDYVPIARSVHQEAVKAMPYGVYHPKSGQDGAEQTVLTSSKEAALFED